MNNLENFSEKKKNIWISTTGYRTLLILRLLIQEERTLDELISLLKADDVVPKSISKDTIRIAINTLRKIGCVIPRPERINNYKYKLLSHPFSLVVSDEELTAFLKLRDILCESYNWEKIFLVNDLFKKIILLTNNEKQIDFVENSKLLSSINKELLTELTNVKLINKKIKIEYNSVKCGLEVLEVIPHRFLYENGKLYLNCYSFKYNQNSILNVERIMKIIDVYLSKDYEDILSYEVVFKVTNDGLRDFSLKENEIVLEKSDKFMVVKAKVVNEFLFVQRILLLGTDFEIISPDSFKEKIVNKLKLLKRGYENE